METKKTLESAYFHTGNSGIILSVEEIGRSEGSSPPNYRLNYHHSAFGTYTDISLPLGSVHMVDYLIESLTRAKAHMIEKGFKAEYALAYGQEPTVDCYINVINGLRRRPVYETRKTSKTATETFVAAFEYFDENDVLVKMEQVDPSQYKSYGEDSSDSE